MYCQTSPGLGPCTVARASANVGTLISLLASQSEDQAHTPNLQKPSSPSAQHGFPRSCTLPVPPQTELHW